MTRRTSGCRAMPFGFLVTCFGVISVDFSRERNEITQRQIPLCSFTLIIIVFFNKRSRNNAIYDRPIFVRFSRRIPISQRKKDADIRRNFGQSNVYALMNDDLLPWRQFRHAEFSVSKLSTTVASYRMSSRRDGCEWSICRLRSSREKVWFENCPISMDLSRTNTEYNYHNLFIYI